MKLVTTDNSDLMQVTSVITENGKIFISGTIMGAMPIRAILSGSELRKGYALVSLGTIWNIIKILLAGKG